ncbi:hypothetical protein, variant [Blastomyces dermatitidis ATCC 26199]|nr:hypothetical protein BDFG_06477 [Blastomyces dermatitidis ATCC 26199]EQL31171.1 hypothetical protein, variant [Blastomyces dermatitidis ATCC 26199]
MNESVSAPTGTPEGSTVGEEGHSQAGSKPPALKDKQCQYCHQPFTSSSLGRHLDQYLFKKKPDGVHDVEEIRRLRSSITRRTARNSSAKRESPDVASPSTTPKASGTESKSESGPRLNGKPGRTGFQVLLNQPTWHSTGVINDIPNTSQASQLRVPATGIDYSARPSDKNGPETTRALELALREVLDNVKAAVSRTESRMNPFDFDLQRQTFPALCLHILSPPPSLFSTHPFPTPTSFPLEPPGIDKRDIIKQAMLVQIQQWKSNQLAAVASSAYQGTGGSNAGSPRAWDQGMIERSAQQHEEMAIRHLELSFNHWISLPQDARTDIWRMEITRAFAREKERREEVENQLARTQQEVNQLQAQIERLENCQWPREFAIFPPEMLPIPRMVSRALAEDSKLNRIDSSRWDYDNLVAKWKRVVMHDKSMGRAGSGVVPSIFPDSNNSPRNNSSNTNSDYHRSGSNSATVHYSQHHYNAKPSSPRRNLPVTPDPSSNQSFAATNTHPTPYQTRDPNRTDEPFRPPKRQRTSHSSRPQHPTQQVDEKADTTYRNLNPPLPPPSSTEYNSQQTHLSRSTYPSTPSTVADTSPALKSKSSPLGLNNDKPYLPPYRAYHNNKHEPAHSTATMAPVSRIGAGLEEQKYSYINHNNNTNSTHVAASNNNVNNNITATTRNGHTNGLEMLMGACSQQQRQPQANKST